MNRDVLHVATSGHLTLLEFPRWGDRQVGISDHDMRAYLAKARRNSLEAEGSQTRVEKPDCE
jgi:hypothetical protein